MFERISVCKLMITMSQKPKGRPVRKIVSDHFVPVEKVKNKLKKKPLLFQMQLCSASIEGRDDNHLKHLIKKHAPKPLMSPAGLGTDCKGNQGQNL